MKSSVSRDAVPSFAMLLKHYRRAAGLTQAQLTERAGLSARAISSLERGVNQFPRRETLQLLIAALGLDEKQQNLLALSRKASTADTLTAVSFSSRLAESKDDALGSHIAQLRASEHHLALADALLVRAMMAIRKHCWRAATDDLDEAFALARAMPYPVVEIKAHYLYGQRYTATGECAKAREAYACAPFANSSTRIYTNSTLGARWWRSRTDERGGMVEHRASIGRSVCPTSSMV